MRDAFMLSIPLLVGLSLLGADTARAQEDLDALLRKLTEGEVATRRGAAEELQRKVRWTKPPRASVPALLAALEQAFCTDEDEDVRRLAAGVLGRLGKWKLGSSVLIRALAHENPQVRALAGFVLGDPGPVPLEALGPLTEALKDPDASVRRVAASALGTLGGQAKPALQALLRVLRSEREVPSVRQLAASTLGKIGPDAAPAVGALAGVLGHEHVDLRGNAAFALGEIGPRAAPAVPQLLVALDDPDPHVRRASAYALGAIGVELERVVPALAGKLSDGEWKVRLTAARTLGQLGPRAADAAPALAKALGERQRLVADAVVSALGKLKEAALPHLLEGLASKNPRVRINAARSLALTKLGAKAAVAVPRLVEALGSKYGLERGRAARALGSIGPKASPAVPALQRLLADEDKRVRRAAARALGSIGSGSAAAIPALLKALEDEDHRVVEEAAEALGKVATRATAPEVVSALTRALKHPKASVRDQVASALSALGSRAEKAGAEKAAGAKEAADGEAAAFGVLKTIQAAQALFREGDRDDNEQLDYAGSLDALGRVNLIDRELARGTKGGYRFKLTRGTEFPEFLWMATASPASGSGRHFAINHEGVVYASSTAFAHRPDCEIKTGTPRGR